MRTVPGLIGQAALLTLLATTTGLGWPGWLAGVVCAIALAILLAGALGAAPLGPAGRVTLTRAVLVGGVAALVADALAGHRHVVALVTIAAVALVLDAVDGQVARRTCSVSAFGARFDMEVDAFLILVLSAYVAAADGVWVLAIGLARYLYGAAGRLWPVLRTPLPPRYWRKVVAAVQGVVLTVAAGGVLPRPFEVAALAGALVLLAESFARDVWWQATRTRTATYARLAHAAR